MELGSFIPYGQHEATISHISLARHFRELALGARGVATSPDASCPLAYPVYPCSSNPNFRLFYNTLLTPGFLPFSTTPSAPLFQPPPPSRSHASASICVQDCPRSCLRLTQKARNTTRTCTSFLSFPLLLFHPDGSRNSRSQGRAPAAAR